MWPEQIGGTAVHAEVWRTEAFQDVALRIFNVAAT
jgi:hypothetical protein